MIKNDQVLIDLDKGRKRPRQCCKHSEEKKVNQTLVEENRRRVTSKGDKQNTFKNTEMKTIMNMDTQDNFYECEYGYLYTIRVLKMASVVNDSNEVFA